MMSIALGRGIEIGLTWKVGFVMAVMPGMKFIHETTCVDAKGIMKQCWEDDRESLFPY